METYPDAKPFADLTKGREDESTLVILVAAAEPLVRDYRARHDPAAGEGMPAHITIIWPFMHPDGLSDEAIGRIEAILARSQPLTFSLGDIVAFNRQVLFLRPQPEIRFLRQPEDPIRALTQAVVEAFPDYPPYGGKYGASVMPHLTVAQKSEEAFDQAEAEFLALADGRLPITVENAAVSLMERRQGLWREMRVFTVGSQVS
jgi:2'-5' RNA ligase